MRVDHLFIGGVRIDGRFHDAFCLIHRRTQGHHLRFDGVAEVGGFGREGGVGFLGEGCFQLLQLIHDALDRQKTSIFELICFDAQGKDETSRKAQSWYDIDIYIYIYVFLIHIFI